MRFRQFFESDDVDPQRTTIHKPTAGQQEVPAQQEKQQQSLPAEVAEYEKQYRLIGMLPSGWDRWNDLQKIIHVTHAMGQKRTTTQGQPRSGNTTNIAPPPKKN